MGKSHCFLVLLSLFCFPSCYAILSKSNPTGLNKETVKDAAESRKIKKSQLQELSEHEHDKTTFEDILDNHDRIDSSAPQFNKIKLAYVTPWNNHGYDVAKWAAKKFTHISPVWFNFKPDEDDCDIGGLHDIDQGWINDIRQNNSEIKIVPRFLFELGTDATVLSKFMMNEQAVETCAEKIADVVKQISGDGAVIEAMLQILAATRSAEGMQAALNFIRVCADVLHSSNLIIVVPMRPPVNEQSESFIEPMKLLYDHVDYVNLMTYDYYGPNFPGSLSPYPWVEQNVGFVLMLNENFGHKTLLGLNYYGLCSGQQNQHIFGKDVVRLLLSHETGLTWNEETKESVFEADSITCVIPTKKSMQPRLDLVMDKDLAGVAIWDLGQGFDHFTDLL